MAASDAPQTPLGRASVRSGWIVANPENVRPAKCQDRSFQLAPDSGATGAF